MNTHRSRGFTLIELLAGITIFALISTTLYGAFGIAVQAFDRAVAKTDSDQHLRVVSGFVQRHLEQSYPLALLNRGKWRLLFNGDSKNIHYVVDLPGILGFGGLYENTIRTRNYNGQTQLLLERRPLIIDKTRGELRGELQTQVLMDDMRSIQLRYYGSVESRGEARWHDEWNDTRHLPLLIEMQITATDGETWPPIVARPRVTRVRFQTISSSLTLLNDSAAVTAGALN